MKIEILIPRAILLIPRSRRRKGRLIQDTPFVLIETDIVFSAMQQVICGKALSLNHNH